ncbi:MAG: ABC transporter ATP-binding protein [Bacteroidetes bacterium]|nr:ABC transporter ATP-binding protein [Bacteroidota bacterium]
MNLLELKHLSKTYRKGHPPAVDGVSFTVRRGEILALVGESGSGKSTLLRLIAGFEIPDSGEIHIDGTAVCGARNFVAPEKRGVGMVFQDGALFPHLTVRENIAFGLHRWERRSRNERIDALLELVGLPEYGKRYPHQLSGGQQQRVAIARALAPEPALLLLDEPFSSLDVIIKEQMREETRAILRRSAATSILVTHDIGDSIALADRIAILRDGLLQQIDIPRNVYNLPRNDYVAALFGKTNILKATCADGGFDTAFGFFPFDGVHPQTESFRLAIKPQDIRLSSDLTNNRRARIIRVIYRGSHKEVILVSSQSTQRQHELVAFVDADSHLAEGAEVSVDVDVRDIRVVQDSA